MPRAAFELDGHPFSAVDVWSLYIFVAVIRTPSCPMNDVAFVIRCWHGKRAVISQLQGRRQPVVCRVVMAEDQ